MPLLSKRLHSNIYWFIKLLLFQRVGVRVNGSGGGRSKQGLTLKPMSVLNSWKIPPIQPPECKGYKHVLSYPAVIQFVKPGRVATCHKYCSFY